MLNTEPQPDILNLFRKLQESTTEDIDEERGSFKKGDKVTYDMFGSGLSNSDLIRTLDTNEHATRANHNGTQAKIVEAIGEEVSRYSIMFEDGFIINDVSPSELKSVNETIEVFQDSIDAEKRRQEIKTSVPRSRPRIRKIQVDLEDISRFGFRGIGFTKDIEEGDTGYILDDDDDTAESWGLKSKLLESKIDEAEDIHVGATVIILHGGYKGERGEVLDFTLEGEDPDFKEEGGQVDVKLESGKTIYVPTLSVKVEESKIDEAEDATDTMKPQEKPNINAEDYHMEDYSDEDLNKPEAKVKSKSEETGNAIRQVEDDELEQKPDKVVTPKKESKLKEEETEFTPSRSEMSNITDEKLRELHKNALKSQKHWAKDRTAPEKAELAKQAVERYKEELVARGMITGVEIPNETKESKFSFMKKQKPLWLCSECHKTFRSDKSVCTLCESKEVEEITEQYGQGFVKEVFKVTWKNTDTGKEESTTVMAFDKADAKKEAKRPNREITKVEGPITEEPRREEAKVPFDQASDGTKLHEDVQELVREVSGIDKDEQEILLKAIEDGVISNEWPSDEIIIDALTAKDVDVAGMSAEDIDGLDMGEIQAVYLKYILLPKALKAARVSSESKLEEQEVEGIPEKGQTYRIHPTSGVNFPDGTYEVTNVEHRKTVKGDLAKQFQVVGDDRWWIAKFYGFKEVASESKLKEQEEDWDLSFMYVHNLIWHNPMVDHEGEYYHWQKQPIRGKRIRVFTDYQADWVERNKAIPVKVDPEGIAEAKKIEHITAVEIVKSQVDPDAYNIRVVELPEGSIVVLDTVEDKKAANEKGKELARVLNAKFLGFVDEKKVEEQEEDTFKTVAKGIVARTLADEIAAKESGTVVTDEEDEKKFMIIVKEE